MDRKIDFLIIGAQKAGTTALYHFLSQHPDIFVPAVKEITYFARDEFYEQGESYLDPFFSDAGNSRLLGAAYVHMMYFGYAAERVRRYNPVIRVIAMLRNPIDRAYSAYWFARRSGWENCATFEEALEMEPKRRTGSYQERSELTYLAHGHYAEQLRAYMDALGPDRVYAMLNEDLSARPSESLTKLLEWLGVEPDVGEIDMHRRIHGSGMPRLPSLHRFLLSIDSPLKRAVRKVTSNRVRYLVRKYLLIPIMERNIRPFKYPPMRAETRQRLAEYYRPHNQALESLLGRSFQHWNRNAAVRDARTPMD